MTNVRKSIAAALTGLVAWGTSVTVSNPTHITSSEGVQLAGVLVAAFLVWLIPNEETS